MANRPWYISEDFYDLIQGLPSDSELSLTATDLQKEYDELMELLKRRTYTESYQKKQEQKQVEARLKYEKLLKTKTSDDTKLPEIDSSLTSTNSKYTNLQLIDKDMKDATKNIKLTNLSKNIFLQTGDFLLKNGIWGDYSKGSAVTKVPDLDKDGNLKYDKDGNPKMKNQYHAGPIAQNILGNMSRYGAFAMSFMKDKETANNSLNNFATQSRKQGQQFLLSSGNPYLMAVGAASMFSDKIGGTASASQTGNFWADAGNTAASFVPFLGFAGKNAGKFIERDDVNASSMYANIGDVYGARSHSGGKFIFKGNDIKDSMDDSNIKAFTISNNILLPANRDLTASMDKRWNIAAQFDLSGGYDLSLVMSGKLGTILQFTKRTVSKQKIKKQRNGGKTQNNPDKTVVRQTKDGNFEIYLDRTLPYEEWIKSIPQDYIGENTYDLELLYNTAIAERDAGNSELWDLLQRWVYAITRPTLEERDFYLNMLLPDENGNMYYPYHTGSVIEEVDENGNRTGNYIFLKLGLRNENPEIKGELDWYNSEQGKEFKEKYDLDSINGRYYYRLKDPKKLKNGGTINVIPEGALHKNKHHLEDIDDKFNKKAVTTKGIPVIVESEGGEVVLQAEVERQEIIFRLEVTKKLEELAKEGTDNAAIEAGKLLTREILYNTKDNTGKMI